jgi:hypothetical protein
MRIGDVNSQKEVMAQEEVEKILDSAMAKINAATPPPVSNQVSVALLKTQPNPVRFPEGNTFLAVQPPDFTTARVGVPSDREFVLAGVVGDALVFADFPNPLGEAFRLIPMRPGMELKEAKP